MNISQISTTLTPTPQTHPTSCLALSSTLTSYLAHILPNTPDFTLSIGSGSGLLEALITHRHPDVVVEGVEVSADVNRYLEELDLHVVPGTWEVHSRAARARAWMFVYPREPALIRRYLECFSGVRVVVWLGPVVDWGDYRGCFGEGWEVEVPLSEKVGVAGFEMVVVLRKEG
ncbi:uncharacterized protein BO97DRAFT_108335 [Aspergillus homomorphus CBS 101889]|uniref:S-adenosyl-L-methionine-dependent methyltransferase n=1 Tax=Aspergillus homomorphus (strain CBS 101889) TaxID=1450537 RepID=A0A395HSX8_ASPHC|nr:hypothetical protein BO97DRAFT_108335 [Aspergillus homomorphus CBS 101889]RAL10937.1 hypothetical protein BO97DRAFT_108335 [Aspergillus homomorphus CBS 101889]